MGILEDLRSMKTPTELAESEKAKAAESAEIKEKEQAEIARAQEAATVRQKILELLSDDNPELDKPYPYMEKQVRKLYTGRSYEERTMGHMSGIELVNPGRETGEETIIFVSEVIVTPREMHLRKLFGEETSFASSRKSCVYR